MTLPIEINRLLLETNRPRIIVKVKQDSPCTESLKHHIDVIKERVDNIELKIL